MNVSHKISVTDDVCMGESHFSKHERMHFSSHVEHVKVWANVWFIFQECTSEFEFIIFCVHVCLSV